MKRSNKPLDLNDLNSINEVAGTSWIPKDPRETILPYIEETDPEENKELAKRRKKSKEVYEGYTSIIEKCKKIEDEISERAKEATVYINRRQHLKVIEAIGRTFGIYSEEITFEMYKIAVQEFAKLSSDSPTPEDL